MSFRHLTYSDDSVQQAAAAPTSGAVTVTLPPDARAQMAKSIPAQLMHDQNGPPRHERDHPEPPPVCPTTISLRVAHIERPRFDRLRTSIADRQLDWAWPILSMPQAA
jgi:hypothetical protein